MFVSCAWTIQQVWLWTKYFLNVAILQDCYQVLSCIVKVLFFQMLSYSHYPLLMASYRSIHQFAFAIHFFQNYFHELGKNKIMENASCKLNKILSIFSYLLDCFKILCFLINYLRIQSFKSFPKLMLLLDRENHVNYQVMILQILPWGVYYKLYM